MNKIKALLVAVCCAALGLLARAADPIAVWNAADFSSTQNGWSIDINGNSLDDIGACTIGTKPIKIVNKAIKGDTRSTLYYTVVMDVSDVPTEVAGTLVTFGRYPADSSYAAYANADLVGVMLDNGTPWGVWTGSKRTSAPALQQALGAETTRLTVVYKAGAGDGVMVFTNGNNKVFKADNGLRATMQVNQINIGGRSDNNTMILSGLKVKRIAVYADSTYEGDETMTMVEIPAGDLRVFTSVPTAEQIAEFLTDDWTGTVWLKNCNWNDWDFGTLGNANSKVRLTGVTGYGPKAALTECNTTIDLVDEGTTPALLQNNGYSTLDDKTTRVNYVFSKMIGTGTFKLSHASANPQIRILDTSDFNGSLNVATMRVAIGEGSSDTAQGKVTIEEGATLTIAPGKSVNAVAGSGTLVLPDFTTSTGVRTSLKNEAWTGTAEVSKHVLTAKTQINLADYGNAGSTIVLKGMIGINSNAGRYLPDNCHIKADVRIDDAVEFNQGSSGANYYFDGTISGTGNLSFLNWRQNDGFANGYHIAKLQNYTGTLTTTRATTIDVLDLAEVPASGTKVVAMSQATAETIQVTKVTIAGEDAPEGSSIVVQADGLYYFATEVVAHIGDTDYPSLDAALADAAQMEGNPVVELYKPIADEVTIPANVTLVQGQDAKVTGAIHGTGTIRIAGPVATGGYNINTFLTTAQLADFAGTIHFASSRIEVAAGFIPTTVTIKVTDGAQLYMGGSSGEYAWGHAFVISGNGWAGETQNGGLSHCAIRAEHPIAETATIECAVVNGVVPCIGRHSADLNVGATITGEAVKFLVYSGSHSIAVDPAKIQVTDGVTLSNVAMNIAAEEAAEIASVLGGTLVKTGAGALTVGDSTTASIKLNGGTIVTANEGLTVTTDVENSHVEYANGAYAIVATAKPVAKIGETMYTDLAVAFAEAQANDTITLLSTVGLTECLMVTDFTGTLDLNGFELTNDESFKKGSDLTWLVQVNGASDFTVTNGTVTVKDGHMIYVFADATMTVAANTTIAEVGDIQNVFRLYAKKMSTTGEVAGTATLNVYGTMTRVAGSIASADWEMGVIDQCLGATVVNVYEGAVLSHASGRLFKMSGGTPTVNVHGGTLTAGGTGQMFHAYSESAMAIDLEGGTFNMGKLFSTDTTAASPLTVTGLGEGCAAKFSTKASDYQTLDDFCATGYKPVIGEDNYYTIQAVQPAYPEYVPEGKEEAYDAWVEAFGVTPEQAAAADAAKAFALNCAPDDLAAAEAAFKVTITMVNGEPQFGVVTRDGVTPNFTPEIYGSATVDGTYAPKQTGDKFFKAVIVLPNENN